MHKRTIAQFLISLLVATPLAFSGLLYFLPFTPFERPEERDIFFLYCGGLWILCSPALMMETFRRALKNELHDRPMRWTIIATCTLLPVLAYSLTPMNTPTIVAEYGTVALCGAGSGIAALLIWPTKT
ncbi:MAG: hypothetical protein OEZ23_06815 [Gammaproteobacteria bacterium]|nr:hypothetical protein [Gammaproteobacteria bacterium]